MSRITYYSWAAVIVFFCLSSEVRGSNSDVILNVPIQVENLRPEAWKVQVECKIYRDAGYSTGSELGRMVRYLYVLDGSVNTTIRLKIRPRGYLATQNGLPDVVRYSCWMNIFYECSGSDGAISRSCTGRSSPAGRVIFEAAPGSSQNFKVEGPIDWTRAEPAPRRHW
jgi:hypothetical protein